MKTFLCIIICVPAITFGQIKLRKGVVDGFKKIGKENQWFEVGPTKYPGTEEERSLTGVGPVKQFLIHSKDTNYCGTASIYGGLFLSKDGGKNWSNSGSDAWESNMCSWFDYHPNDPNIIAATSIVFPTKNGGEIGVQGGVMLTLDHGKQWQKIADYNDLGGEPGLWLFKVVLTEDFKCYVATSSGLFYCKDIFASKPKWKHLLFDESLSDIEVFQDGLLISAKRKGTENWSIQYMPFEKNRFKTIPYSFDDKGLSNIKFEVVRGQSEHFYYMAQFDRKPDYLIRSSIKGEMEVLNDRMTAVFGFGLSLAVNPDDEDIIFAGYGVTLQKSVDGGKTFTTVQGKYHVDIEGISFHPVNKNELYISTHGGVYRTTDLGNNWENWSEGIGIAEVMGMGVGYDGFPIAVGLFHDGSLVFSKDSIWRHITPGDGINSYVDWEDSRYVYISNQHGAGGLFASNDSGKTFLNVHKTSGFKTSGWSMCFVQNTKEPDVFYFNYKRKYTPGMSEGYDVVRSDKRGLGAYHTISDFNRSHGFKKYNLYDLYVNPNKPGTLYAYILLSDSGEIEHKIFKNDSTLSTQIDSIYKYWEEVEIPVNTWIGDIEFNSQKEEEMFIIKGSPDFRYSNFQYGKEMVYRVDLSKNYNCDKEKHCQDITWNLPNSNIERLASYLDHRKHRLFIGTSRGLYYLDLKKMDEWRKFGEGLPNVIIRQIQVSGDGKNIFVGTRGRGVWRHPY